MDDFLFILDEDNNVVPTKDTLQWADWFEKATKDTSRVVKQDRINDKFISTVFLGTPYGFDKNNPLVFETMVFKDDGKYHDAYLDRYNTYDEALKGHEKAVQWVKDGCKDD